MHATLGTSRTRERETLQALFRAMPEPLLAVDPDWRVLMANPEAVDLLGGGDPVGHPMWEVLPEDLTVQLRRACERAMRLRRPCTCECHVPGDDTWHEVHAFPVGEGLAVHLRDVTERRAAAERLREDRERTSALIDHMSAGIVVTDLDGRVVETNARFLEMTGLGREQVVGSVPPHAWWSPLRGGDYERSLEAQVRRGRVGHVETFFRARSGREFPARVGVSPLLDERGVPVAVIKTVSDITEEHLARQRLRRSEAEFRLLAEQTSDLICRHDRDGRMRYVSPASRRVLGQTPFAVRGRRLESFVHPGDRGTLGAAFASVLRDGRDRTLVVRGRRPGGDRVWLESTIRRVDGAPEGEQLISTTRDVTERHLSQLEHAATVRITDAVAAGAGVPAAAALIAEEVGRLLETDAGVVWRFDDDAAVAVAAWGAQGARPGTRLPLGTRGAVGRVAETGSAARVHLELLDRGDPVAALMRVDGHRTSLSAPIIVGDRLWGALLVGLRDRTELSEAAEAQLARFADLAATTIERAEASAELTLRAERDRLTGVANRAVFDDRLAQAAARGERLALCLIDLDHFKLVNDTHGHDVGDQVLRRVAGRLQEAARRGDLVARVGGEEFGWVMPETGLEDAVRAAERARMLIEATVVEPAGPVTVSIGISTVEPGPWDPAELFRTSDRALYAAKRSGRDRVVGLPG